MDSEEFYDVHTDDDDDDDNTLREEKSNGHVTNALDEVTLHFLCVYVM